MSPRDGRGVISGMYVTDVPTVISGDRDRDSVAVLLLACEAGIHERGWDQDPDMLLVYVDGDYMRARTADRRLWNRPGAGSPGESLERAARWLPRAKPPATPLPFADSGDGYAALVFHSEAWTLDKRLHPGTFPSDADLADFRSGDIAKRPDRVEMRMLYAVDINNRHYMLTRMRHWDHPRITLFGTGPGGTGSLDWQHGMDAPEPDQWQSGGTMQGRIPPALERIQNAIRTGVLRA